MHKKFSPIVLSLLSVAVLACSGTPNTTSAATAPTPTTPAAPQQSSVPVSQSAQPPQQGAQQPPPPVPPSYQPNCQGCIQLKEGDAFTVIKAQRAMMGLQTEWKADVDQMNQKFAAQQKIIQDKLEEIKKSQKVPANYQFDYQNLQFVPSPASPAKK